MERLTTERSWEDAKKDLSNEMGYSHIWKRLNEIENILGKEYDIDRLRDLVEADRDGRCMVLQTNCNNAEKTLEYGDIVYQADKERIYEMKIKKIIYDCGHVAFDYDAIGKTVLLTREEAEAAMKGENYHE